MKKKQFVFYNIFFLLFTVILLMPTTDAFAIISSARHETDSKQENRFSVNPTASNMDNNLGRKLTLRERIALKILKGQFGKVWQTYASSDTTPSVSCSKIVLKNGKTIEANISQISQTEVKYRRCGFPSDPEMIESKDDVSVVLAADGGTLFVNSGTNRTSTLTITQDNLAPESNAKQAFWLSLLAWLSASFAAIVPLLAILAILCAIAAIIYGIRSLAKIKKEPQKYKGKGLAIAGIIIASLFLFLVIVGAAAMVA